MPDRPSAHFPQPAQRPRRLGSQMTPRSRTGHPSDKGQRTTDKGQRTNDQEPTAKEPAKADPQVSPHVINSAATTSPASRPASHSRKSPYDHALCKSTAGKDARS